MENLTEAMRHFLLNAEAWRVAFFVSVLTIFLYLGAVGATGAYVLVKTLLK
jgi:hypothetical protein